MELFSGLIGIAMGMQDFTSSHRENNSHLVSLAKILYFLMLNGCYG